LSKLLEILRNDHVNMTRLLDALERQLAVFDAGARPDYDFIAGLLQYCRGFPDRYHHPREDLIVGAMQRRAPAAAREIAALAREHERLSALTERFADAVEQVLQDQEMPRGRFDGLAREFIEFYRRHLTWEEETVFPRAETVLTESDWRAVDARIAAPDDPLFGGIEEERFRALRRALLESDAD